MIYRSYQRLNASLRRALELYGISLALLIGFSFLFHTSQALSSLQYYALNSICCGWLFSLFVIFRKKIYQEAQLLFYEKSLFFIGMLLYLFAMLSARTDALFLSYSVKLITLSVSLTFLDFMQTFFYIFVTKKTKSSIAEFVATYYGTSRNISYFSTLKVIFYLQFFAATLFFIVSPHSFSLDALTIFFILCLPASYGLSLITSYMLTFAWFLKHTLYIQSPQSLYRLQQCSTFLASLDDFFFTQAPQLSSTHWFAEITDSNAQALLAKLSAHSGDRIIRSLSTNTNEPSEIAIINIREFPGKGVRGTFENQEWFLGTARFIEELRFTTLEAKNNFKLAKKESKKQAPKQITTLYLATTERLYGYFFIKDTLDEKYHTFFTNTHRCFANCGIITAASKEIAQNYGASFHASIIISDLLPKKEPAKIKQLENENHSIALLASTGHEKALALATTSFLISSTQNTKLDFCLEPETFSEIFPLLCSAIQTLKWYQRWSKTVVYIWFFAEILLSSSLIYPLSSLTIEKALALSIFFSLFFYSSSAFLYKRLKRLRFHQQRKLPALISQN